MTQPEHNKKWDAAADRLLTAVPSPTTRQVLKETAAQLGIPLWMLITGLLQKCYDSGDHTAPVLDPHWTMGNPVNRPEIPEAKCAHCHRNFTPRWIGQEYCDVKCGSAAALVARDRAYTEPALVRFQVGQEPEGTAKSTINELEAHGRASDAPEGRKEIASVGAESSGKIAEDPVATIERAAQASLGA